MNFKKILIFFTLVFSLFILIGCDPTEDPDDPIDKDILVYTGSSLDDGIVGITYSVNIATATGSDAITYTLKQGSSLPVGLSLIGPLVHGIPTTAGTTEFVIVANAENAEAPVEATFTITINEPADTTKPDMNTYIYEAEYTDLTDQRGSGWSNTQTEWQMVMGDGTDGTDASNGMYVAAFVPPYATLTFEFTAEESGVGKLSFSMTSEYVINYGGMEAIVLNPAIMTFKINGTEMDYAVPVLGRSQPNTEWQEYVFFEEFDIVEGVNTISMEMLLNDYFPGRPGGGPNVDYMKIESEVDLTMNLYSKTVEDVIMLRGF